MKRILSWSVSLLVATACLLGAPIGQALADDPDAPVISDQWVGTENTGTPESATLYGYYCMKVDDPNGSAPYTLSGITVMGPGDYVRAVDLYNDGLRITTNGDDRILLYRYRTTELPQEGEYTFVVSDTEGKMSGTTFMYTAGDCVIDVPDVESFLPEAYEEVDLTPTLSWAPVSSTGCSVYYAVSVFLSWSPRLVFGSPRSDVTSYTIPAGILEKGKEYDWYVMAQDGID